MTQFLTDGGAIFVLCDPELHLMTLSHRQKIYLFVDAQTALTSPAASTDSSK